MKSVTSMVLGVVMALCLVGVPSASAANWDPQNTNVTVTQEGAGALTFTGGSISCTAADMTLRAVGAVATTTTTTNPLVLTGCNSGVLGVATVTTFGDWSFTATSTTTVDATWTSGTGTVVTFHFPSAGCDLTITSPVHIPNNMWNNTTHTLTINNTVAIPVEGSGICPLLGSSLRLDANFVAPALTIT